MASKEGRFKELRVVTSEPAVDNTEEKFLVTGVEQQQHQTGSSNEIVLKIASDECISGSLVECVISCSAENGVNAFEEVEDVSQHDILEPVRKEVVMQEGSESLNSRKQHRRLFRKLLNVHKHFW